MSSILIIGCGSIGERHLRCFQKTGRCTVTACDTNPALLSAMRERYGATGFATLDEALAASTYDAAVICTPAHLHLPMAKRLLGLGLHVFIEKPLATTVADAERVVACARANGRKLVIGYILRHHPSWMKLIALARPELARMAQVAEACLHIEMDHHVRAEGTQVLIDGDANLFRVDSTRLRHQFGGDLTSTRYPQAGVQFIASEALSLGISGLVGALLGVPLGVFLRLTDHGGVLQNGGETLTLLKPGPTTNDPMMGVIRHADAGYDLAQKCADRLDVPVPMRTWK